jgi:hypothetical protein
VMTSRSVVIPVADPLKRLWKDLPSFVFFYIIMAHKMFIELASHFT